MNGCESSREIILVPLKDHISGTNFFGNKHIIAAVIARWLRDLLSK